MVLPTATRPAPPIAPINACVVEIGRPRHAATATVTAPPPATAKAKRGCVAIADGTSPAPVNVLSKACARNTEHNDPASVAALAHSKLVQ